MDGLILIDKQVGATSYDAVRLVKRIFNTNKVGHCGTLDPFASGLLIIGINQATKVMTFLEHDYKEYEAVIKLGSFTDTYDLTGKVIENKEVVSFNKETLENVLASFLGEITQVPPIYSSIHIDGKKLYEYARENIKVDVPERKVNIFDIKLLDYTSDTIKIYVKCSRGTYIRSLGVDIAKKLDNLGHLISLRRLSIGNVSVNDANNFDSLKEGNVNLIPICKALSFKNLHIKDERILKRVYNGQDLILKNEVDDHVIVIDDNKEVAIYEKVKECVYHCIRGLYDEAYRFKRLKELQG